MNQSSPSTRITRSSTRFNKGQGQDQRQRSRQTQLLKALYHQQSVPSKTGSENNHFSQGGATTTADENNHKPSHRVNSKAKESRGSYRKSNYNIHTETPRTRSQVARYSTFSVSVTPSPAPNSKASPKPSLFDIENFKNNNPVDYPRMSPNEIMMTPEMSKTESDNKDKVPEVELKDEGGTINDTTENDATESNNPEPVTEERDATTNDDVAQAPSLKQEEQPDNTQLLDKGEAQPKSETEAEAETETETEQPKQKQPLTEEELAAQSARRAEWPLTNISEPGPNDCLFGRGGGTNHHPGNKRYRKIVEDRKPEYLSSKRLDKPLVALDIIREWRAQDPPGRFLKQDEKTKMWNDVGDRKAREKTSQALREKSVPKKGEGGEGGGSDDEFHSHQFGGVDQQTRFAEGSSPPRKANKSARPALVARDHSLGTEFLTGKEQVTLDGFSWDEMDAAIIAGELGNEASSPVAPSPAHPPPSSSSPAAGRGHYPPPPHHGSRYYPYAREHSLSRNPLADASVSHSAHNPFGDPYGPPPPLPPPPPTPPSSSHHRAGSYQERRRDHSFTSNPLPGASTSQPAHNTFAHEDQSVPWGRSMSYDGHGPPPPPPPHYHHPHGPPPGYYYPPPPPPSMYYGSPPPHYPPPVIRPNPQYLGHAPERSAFARTDSDARSIRSYGSHDSGMYAKRHSGSRSHRQQQHNDATTWSSNDFSKIADLMNDDDDNVTNKSDSNLERSNTWDGSSEKQLLNKDSSIGSYPPYDAPPTDSEESSCGEIIRQRSNSLPHSRPGTSEGDGSSFPSPPRNLLTRKKPSAESGNGTNSSGSGVQKPNLMRKISGGGLAARKVAIAPNGIRRPEPVKRDTSSQPENMETKRSIKRAVLSRDASAAARVLKEEQKIREEGGVSESVSEDDYFADDIADSDAGEGGAKVSAKLAKAALLDRKLSVEINKLGLADKPISLSRMRTEDVLAELMDDDDDEIRDVLGAPEPLSANDRVTTIDAIAMDIANGRPGSVEIDDLSLGLLNDVDDAPIDDAPVAVDEDLAEKWLNGNS